MRAVSLALLAVMLLFARIEARAANSGIAQASQPLTHVFIPCLLDGGELGEVDSTLTADYALISIDGRGFLSFLKPLVSVAAWDRVNNSIDPNGRLTPTAVAAAGLGLEYDASRLEITLSIAMEMRHTVDVTSGAALRKVTPSLASTGTPAAGHVTPQIAAALTRVSIPCSLDGVELGEVDTNLAANNVLVSIEGRGFVDLLKPVVSVALWNRVNNLLDVDGHLTPSAVAASGLGLEYDAARLEIVLSIPAEMRRTVEIKLGAGTPKAETPPLTPADASAYVNVRAGREYITGSGLMTTGWQPTTLSLDGAATVFGTTLEAAANYQTASGVSWARGDMRLVHDFPESRLRITAGDLSYSIDGFQSVARAGGISIGRDFALQPYRSSAPSGLTTVLIDQRSRVDVIVNGQRLETLNLGPGQYNVRDFPFAQGANDISLRVTDQVGRVQTINFPFVYDSTVLNAGEQDFSYVFGFAAQPTLTGRSYATNQPLGSMYHAVGLTDQLTVGVNIQGSPAQQTGGLEARWATKLGTFRLDGAGSIVPGLPDGYAARLTYRYVDAIGTHTQGRSIEFSGIYRSPTFATLGMNVPSNPVAFDFGVRYGQRVIGNLYGSIGYGRQIGRQGTRDSQSLDAGVSAPLREDMSAYLLVNRITPMMGSKETRVFLAVSWFPRGTGHSLTASHDTQAHDTQFQYHYTPSHLVDAFEADAVVDRVRSETTLRGELNYTGYRFSGGVSQASSLNLVGGGDQHETSLTAGSALAFADGHFAISRPISDSFGMIVPHLSLDKYRIEVNPMTGVPDARTDWLGNAVLTDLVSYYKYQAVIDAPDLPDGFDLGPGFYALQPHYRSGTVIHVGTGATVLLEAILVDLAGTPMGLELGTISMPDDPAIAPIDFFTSKEGRVRVAGLKPGRATIRLANYPEVSVTVDIPPKTAGRYEAGQQTIEIEPPMKSEAELPKE